MFAREMRDHFRTWGGGERIDVQRLGSSPDELAEYRLHPYKLQFFSDVNGAVARWAWEQVRYREVPYAEDQLIAREMIESGYAKVFHPGAAVYHSHDYPPAGFLRRYFDEFRSLREVLGHVEPFGLEHVARTVYHQTRLDREYLEGEGVEGAELRRAVARSARHYLIRTVGAGLGARADRLPRPARKALSLEGRGSFAPLELPQSPLQASAPLPAVARPRPLDRFEFVRAGFPRRPIALEPPPGSLADKESLTLAWVLPPWRRGSGGHMTIFRLVQMMERRGHRCVIFVFDPAGNERARGRRAQAARSSTTSSRSRRRCSTASTTGSAPTSGSRPVVDGVSDARPARVLREGLPRSGLRARLLSVLGRVHLGRGDLSHGLPVRRLHALDGGDPSQRLRPRVRVVRMRHRPRHLHVRRGRTRARNGRRLRAPGDGAARRRACARRRSRC